MKKHGRSSLYINKDIAPMSAQGDRLRARRTRQTEGTPSGTILGTRSKPMHDGKRSSGN